RARARAPLATAATVSASAPHVVAVLSAPPRYRAKRRDVNRAVPRAQPSPRTSASVVARTAALTCGSAAVRVGTHASRLSQCPAGTMGSPPRACRHPRAAASLPVAQPGAAPTPAHNALEAAA